MEVTIQESDEKVDKIREHFAELKNQESRRSRSGFVGTDKQLPKKSPEALQKTMVDNNRMISQIVNA